MQARASESTAMELPTLARRPISDAINAAKFEAAACFTQTAAALVWPSWPRRWRCGACVRCRAGAWDFREVLMSEEAACATELLRVLEPMVASLRDIGEGAQTPRHDDAVAALVAAILL